MLELTNVNIKFSHENISCSEALEEFILGTTGVMQ